MYFPRVQKQKKIIETISQNKHITTSKWWCWKRALNTNTNKCTNDENGEVSLTEQTSKQTSLGGRREVLANDSERLLVLLAKLKTYFIRFFAPHQPTIFTSNFRCSESDLLRFYFYGCEVTVVNGEFGGSAKVPPMNNVRERCSQWFSRLSHSVETNKNGASLQLIGLPIFM